MPFIHVVVRHIHELDNSLGELQQAPATPSFEDVQAAFAQQNVQSNSQQAYQGNFAAAAQDGIQHDDKDVDERRLFEGACTIAAGFVARNVSAKHDYDAGLKLETIAKRSVELAQLIHGNIHSGEAAGTI